MCSLSLYFSWMYFCYLKSLDKIDEEWHFLGAAFLFHSLSFRNLYIHTHTHTHTHSTVLGIQRTILLDVLYISWLCCLVAKSCLTLGNPIDCSTPGFPVHHHLPEFAQTHVHGVGDATQEFYPLFPPSSPAFNLSLYQGLFQMIQFFTSGGQSIGASVQHQSF